ncbi:MAG: hypothetical protein ACE366_25685 [Bradymonadia bacterium]
MSAPHTITDHIEVLDGLIRLYEVHLGQFHRDPKLDWSAFGEARQTIIDAWRLMTPLTELLPDEAQQARIRERMERLEALNVSVVEAAESSRADLNRRLGALRTGRKGLKGYQRHLGPARRSQLGRG